MAWNTLMILLIAFCLVVIPYEVSFGEIEVLNNVKPIIKGFFLINVFFIINTSFYEKGGLVNTRGTIFKHFIKNRLLTEIITLLCLFVERSSSVKIDG